ALVGCGDGGDDSRGTGGYGSGAGISITAGDSTGGGGSLGDGGTSDGSGGGSDSAGGDTQGASGGSGDDSTGGIKFDIGSNPDGGALDCDEINGGQDMDLSYIWIANTDVGTVSKIDTRSGVIEGRYRTANTIESPSRTTVNQFGDMLVGNRGDVASVTAIASFEHRCVDKNQNGVIETSTGYDDVRAWGEDECVLWHASIPATYELGPRGLAWEGGVVDPITCENSVPNPRVWVAFDRADSYDAWRFNGQTGEVLDKVSIPGTSGRPYGGAVNREGDFWFVIRGSQLVYINSETLSHQLFATPDVPYGMSIDANGDPWFATYNAGAGDQIYRFDTQTTQFVSAGGGQGKHRGMMIDHHNRAWVIGNSPCRLILVDAENEALIDDNIPLPGCSDPVGVSIDIDDYVWVVDRGASKAYKIDPDTLAIEFTVEGLNHPYTYSDMTGSLLRLVADPLG
ncbi:MAG: hypothetical protein KC468_15910, partial [Myxococcales bacterium]|nr:hypothetical protein [Myxococcales bacterium]